MEYDQWLSYYDEAPPQLTEEDKREWAKKLKNVCLGSDAFFPFRDNVDRANLVIIIFLISFYITHETRMLNQFIFFSEWCSVHRISVRLDPG